MRRYIGIVALASVLGLVGVACGGGGGGTTGTTAQHPQRGGELRIESNADTTAAMDPQKEYYQLPWMLYRCCLLRTLLSYNGLDAAHNGAELFPDLASGMPTVSKDGLTWTFHLKQGLHYAPPLQDVEITAPDIVRALMREGTPSVAAAYAFYYYDIVGFTDFMHGKAKTISGLVTPDAYTLEVHLTAPTGDLGYRFGLPATAPIPPNPGDPSAPLGVAEGHDSDYGRFLVASGPYMYAGSQQMDLSKQASQQQPASGYQVGADIHMVRNPAWSDDDLRPAYVDAIDFAISPGAEASVLEKKVQNNEIDTVFSNGVTPQTLQAFESTPDLRNRIFINPGPSNYYIAMNMAVPPFDDIHVRKAAEYAIDKAGYQRLHGGPDAAGPVAGHYIPNVDENNLLENYNPYATPEDRGVDTAQGLQLAMNEMKQSPYDTNHDGKCDASVCSNVLAIGVVGAQNEAASQLFTQNLAKIGIQLNYRAFEDATAYNKVEDPKNHVAWADFVGWIHDYPDGYTWLYPTMYGPNILSQYNTNYSLVGASAAQLRGFGYSVTSVPGMNAQIQKCFPLTGDARTKCWADDDRYLMENIAPVVPLVFSNVVNIVSDRVTNWTWSLADQAPSLDHVALANGGA
jgi:peptide/nickel transport system substrate-binding protein